MTVCTLIQEGLEGEESGPLAGDAGKAQRLLNESPQCVSRGEEGWTKGECVRRCVS